VMSSEGPSSTSLPCSKTAIWSLTCSTTARSWAIKRYVKSSFSWRSIRRLTIWAWTETSSALTGSSQMMNSGSTARARAIPILWRWPPLNSWGKRRAKEGSRPTSLRSSATLSDRSEANIFGKWISKGSARIVPILNRGFSEL